MKIISEFKKILFYYLFRFPGKIGYIFRKISLKYKFKNKNNSINVTSNFNFKGEKNITIGKNFSADDYCYLDASSNGQIKIGNNLSLNRNVHINASLDSKIIIGNNVYIGPNVVIRSASHKIIPGKIKKTMKKKTFVFISDNVWIGANSTILNGANIGKNCVIAANTVVKKKIKSNYIFSIDQKNYKSTKII